MMSHSSKAALPEPELPAFDRFVRATADRRCYCCGWALAPHQSEGCTPGDCSYRPDESHPTYARWHERMQHVAAWRAALATPNPDVRAALVELADYHDKQATHFEPFGANNVLSVFHRSAASTCRAALAAADSAPAPVAWRYRYHAQGSWHLANEPALAIHPDNAPGFEQQPLYTAPVENAAVSKSARSDEPVATNTLTLTPEALASMRAQGLISDTAAPALQEREAFEAYWTENGDGSPTSCLPNGDYVCDPVHEHWTTWQAALSEKGKA